MHHLKRKQKFVGHQNHGLPMIYYILNDYNASRNARGDSIGNHNSLNVLKLYVTNTIMK